MALIPQPLALEPPQLVVKTLEYEITASPSSHSVPVIGLRLSDLRGGGTMAYSADGEPSAGAPSLAPGVDLLVHEATGAHPGHSTAEGAAQLAREAGARRLVLVHLAPLENDSEAQRQAGVEVFGREVTIGEDLARFDF